MNFKKLYKLKINPNINILIKNLFFLYKKNKNKKNFNISQKKAPNIILTF